MSDEQNSAGGGEGLASEVRGVREVLLSQLAAAQERLTQASAEAAAMRAGRDHSRQGQVAAEVRVMQLQKDVAALTDGAVNRERACAERDEAWGEKILAAQKNANVARLELGRTSDKLAMAEAIARNAQNQVTQYEAAQRAQMARLGELEPRNGELEQRVQAQEALIAQLQAERARVVGEYEAQARQLIAAKKTLEGRVSELAGARSRRLLTKLHLVSRCHWEK